MSDQRGQTAILSAHNPSETLYELCSTTRTRYPTLTVFFGTGAGAVCAERHKAP